MQAVHALVMRASQGHVAEVADYSPNVAKLMTVVDAQSLLREPNPTALAQRHRAEGKDFIPVNAIRAGLCRYFHALAAIRLQAIRGGVMPVKSRPRMFGRALNASLLSLSNHAP